jgi:GT2 family glycosyltransferase/glycosyltransferase involved in cell wall biosynthesis
MSEKASCLQRLWSKGRCRLAVPGRFTGVPCPQRDFAPTETLTPLQQIKITPYGYLSTGNSPQFLVSQFSSKDFTQHLKVKIGFTSFDCVLSPRLCFDCGNGFDEKTAVDLPIYASGRIEHCVSVPAGAKRVRFDPVDKKCIFVFHYFTITPYTPADFAALDGQTRARPFDIICFPIIDWHYRFQRPQQLLSHFARSGHRVFYVSTQLNGLTIPKITAVPIAENIISVSLPGNSRLNIYKDAVSPNSLEQGLHAFVEYLRTNDCNEAVICLDLPFWFPFAEELRRRFGWKIVYDCMDEHSGFENNEQSMLCQEENAITGADLLIASSQVLFEKCKRRNPHCALIRNAGDYQHFSREVPRSQSPLSHLPQPVIGYYGALAEWFDVEALELALQRHPDWSFVLIGHVHEEKITRLAEFKNLHLLGEKPYGELPELVAGFDVCTIPFRRNVLTEATNPVKIYEYFATGKPVVARHLPELESLSELIYLYDEPGQFVDLLDRAVNESSVVLSADRRKAASQNTWDERVSSLEQELTGLHGKASIIIVSYQCFDYLRECVASVLQNTQYPNFEVIIVDNASDAPVVDYLRQLEKESPRVKVILNKENRGFAAANNQGLRLAEGSEFYLLLNNDTVTPPGWLSKLVFWAGKPEIGLVGPVSNCVGNEAQIAVNYTNMREMPDFSRALMHGYCGECFDIKVLAMFCVAFRREVFEKVGYLDESFGLGMFEDDDYAQRMRREGYRVVCAEDAFVHHYGSASFAKLPEEQYRELFEKNRRIYESKWGAWIPHKYR